MRRYRTVLKQPGRDLRNAMTEAEQVLWERVRRKQIDGVQFYRQKPIERVIVDFFAPKAGLVIEVDGAQHQQKDHAERDQYRDAFLEQLDLKVLRFSNDEVLRRTHEVVEKIREAVRQASSPKPPFKKGGLGGFLPENEP